MQGAEVQSPTQLISCRLKRGRAWVKLADAESSTVKVTAEEAQVACFIRGVLQSHTAVELVRRDIQGLLSAADAFAEGDVAGLGGWWLMPGRPLQSAQMRWFSLRLRRQDLPGWFTAACKGPGLQQVVCSLTALAQLLLLAGIAADLAQSPDGFNTAFLTVSKDAII